MHGIPHELRHTHARATPRTLRRVVPLSAPRMAPADALDRAPSAATRAMLVDRVDRVLAARRHIPALPAEQSPERHAIEENEMDEQPAHGANEMLDRLDDPRAEDQ